MFGLRGKRYKGPERRHYDVFISYRRSTGSEAARLVRLALIEHGFRVFLDVDDLPGGHFDERLLVSIENSRGFLPILSKDCLARINDPGDWLYREIAHATERERNIVPLMMPDFAFPHPKTLPEVLRNLARLNGVAYSHEYFDAMVLRIVERLGAPQGEVVHRPADEAQTERDRRELGKEAEMEALALQLYKEAQEWLEDTIEEKTQVMSRPQLAPHLDREKRRQAVLEAEHETTLSMLEEIKRELEREGDKLQSTLEQSTLTMTRAAYEDAVKVGSHVQQALKDADGHITRMGMVRRKRDRQSAVERDSEETLAKVALSHARLNLSKLAHRVGRHG